MCREKVLKPNPAFILESTPSKILLGKGQIVQEGLGTLQTLIQAMWCNSAALCFCALGNAGGGRSLKDRITTKMGWFEPSLMLQSTSKWNFWVWSKAYSIQWKHLPGFS